MTDAHGHSRAGGAGRVAEPDSPEPGTASGGGQAPGAPPNGGADHAAELARVEDRYKRARADLDNYRKRSARDLELRVQQSRESLLLDWLEALDSVERALQMSHGSPSADGLQALLEQMETILARHGARRIGAAGEPFDPERHEAIEARPSTDVPDRTVLEAVRSGWAIGDRVLRPALVIVARRPDPIPG